MPLSSQASSYNSASLIELAPPERDGIGLIGHIALQLSLPDMILPENGDAVFRIMLSLRGGRLH